MPIIQMSAVVRCLTVLIRQGGRHVAASQSQYVESSTR